jgi:succinyl-diaminopimelate desuccinylase
MQNPVDLIHQERLVELAKSLISIPSVTGEEHALSDWYFNYFNDIGLSNIRRLPVEGAGDTIVGYVEGRGEGPDFLINPHIDTFAVCDGWETDPFTPTLIGDKLFGLGAHDMKGGVACALGAVEAIIQAKSQLKGRLIVALTSDEENWSRGAHALIQHGLIDNAAYCLNPEPTPHGWLKVGARGRHVFHLKFQGKTTHAAYGGGVNALLDAATVAKAIAGKSAIDLGYDDSFDLTGSICVIGLHSGGTLILVPELADLYVDRHVLPGETVEMAAEQIRKVVENAGIQSTYTLTWDERPTPAPPAFAVPSDSDLVRTVRRILAEEQGNDIDLTIALSVSDMNHTAVHGGVPTLILGPDGGNTCLANEYVLVDSMPAIARTYVRAVLDLIG